jgi:hypothetical protein
MVLNYKDKTLELPTKEGGKHKIVFDGANLKRDF